MDHLAKTNLWLWRRLQQRTGVLQLQCKWCLIATVEEKWKLWWVLPSFLPFLIHALCLSLLYLSLHPSHLFLEPPHISFESPKTHFLEAYPQNGVQKVPQNFFECSSAKNVEFSKLLTCQHLQLMDLGLGACFIKRKHDLHKNIRSRQIGKSISPPFSGGEKQRRWNHLVGDGRNNHYLKKNVKKTSWPS